MSEWLEKLAIVLGLVPAPKPIPVRVRQETRK